MERWRSEARVAFKGQRGEPVTATDRQVDRFLHAELVSPGEGWLSEETADDHERLSLSRVWVVDPLDGTREFVLNIPEFAVSVALVEDGEVVAAGVCNPVLQQVFLGSTENGVTLNGQRVEATHRTALEGATVLASRSEIDRGEWSKFSGGPLRVMAMGSIAYKLALVSAGQADATLTLVPKNEWDLAAGVLLVVASGGKVTDLHGRTLTFNGACTRREGAIAASTTLFDTLFTYVTEVVEQ